MFAKHQTQGPRNENVRETSLITKTCRERNWNMKKGKRFPGHRLILDLGASPFSSTFPYDEPKKADATAKILEEKSGRFSRTSVIESKEATVFAKLQALGLPPPKLGSVLKIIFDYFSRRRIRLFEDCSSTNRSAARTLRVLELVSIPSRSRAPNAVSV